MSELGKRITEERKLLGLSQAAFAELVGVSFSSQRRYEDGRSAPDTTYLDSLRAHGIDVSYIMSGRRTATGRAFQDYYLAEFGLAVVKLFGISEGEFNDLVSNASEATKGIPDSDNPVEIDRRIAKYEAAFQSSVANLFQSKNIGKSSKTTEGPDPDLLSSLLSQTMQVSKNEHINLPPEKLSRVVAMLYMAFKECDKIDLNVVRQAVELAGN